MNADSNQPPAADAPVSKYAFSRRFSRPITKIGAAATRAAYGTRNVLLRDIRLPATEKLLGDIGTVTAPVLQNAKAISDLKKIVKRSREVLISASTVFPPRLFQDTIVVDRTKVTIIKRNFLWSADVIGIRIEDILNVSTSVGPIFGSLNISSRVMNSTDHFQIGSFMRNTVIDVKHIIQGYMIARNNNIDTDHLSAEELATALSELGQDSAR